MKKKRNKFQNEPSRRMYFFLNELVARTDISMKEIFEKFGKYKENPSNYFNALDTGTISVKIEEILIAQQYFRLDPCILFEQTKNAFYGAFADTAPPSKQLKVDYEEKIFEKERKIKEMEETIKSQQETIHSLVTGVRKKVS